MSGQGLTGSVVVNTSGEANAQRGSVFFFETAGDPPVVGFGGDLDGTSTDDNFFAIRDESTGLFNSVCRELDTIDGQTIVSPIVPVDWVDAQGNTYAAPAGAFSALPEIFAGTIPDDLFARIALPGPVCRVDLDGDGEPTIFDFLEFQNEFDAGCA
ncbi:MAG: hypothetical protein AAFX79_06785 [Planctomycetota bacterium]